MEMLPALTVNSFGVGAEEQELGPFTIVELRRVLWPRDMGLTAIGEFDLGPRAAIWAANQ
jgi:hypothetical protein